MIRFAKCRMNRLVLAGFALALVVGSAWAQDSGQDSGPSKLTARDVRMAAETRWDYQPGQGPKRKYEKDYFRPTAREAAYQPLPAKPVVKDDWRDPPAAETRVPPKEVTSPATETGIDVGAQFVATKSFDEGASKKEIRGFLGGLSAGYTGLLGDQWFAQAKAQFTAGNPLFEQAGSKEDAPQYAATVRALVGRDLLWGRFAFSPFVGFGYRYALSDFQKATLDSYAPHQRQTHLLFAPIGVNKAVLLGNGDRITATGEFAPIFAGWQNNKLSQASANYDDLSNKLDSGYGLRGEIAYQTERLAVGPFVHYWDIDGSATDCSSGAMTVCLAQPRTRTLEYGLQLRYLFH